MSLFANQVVGLDVGQRVSSRAFFKSPFIGAGEAALPLARRPISVATLIDSRLCLLAGSAWWHPLVRQRVRVFQSLTYV